MRFLLARTDALGDLVISLPVMARILERDAQAEVHWLVRPYTAAVLEGMSGVRGVHVRDDDSDLARLMRSLRPDVLLNLSHRDDAVISAASEAGVPMRVARPRGAQLWHATHRVWRGRRGSGRHEAQNALDFLKPLGWGDGVPAAPRLILTELERGRGEKDLASVPHPRLGLILRGSGAGAFPSEAWWCRAFPVLQGDGWRTVTLGPPEASELQPSDLRGLMARLAACDAVLGPSTGPTHLASVLGVPVLALMGRRPSHGADRWGPLGECVRTVSYPGPEADLSGGMDRLEPHELLPLLEGWR